MGGKLSAEERMRLLCEKSLPFAAKMLYRAGKAPWRDYVTLGIPENDLVKGVLEVGITRERWYVLAGALPVGSDRLVSRYLKFGTKDEIRAYMEGTRAPGDLETALRELIREAER